VQESCFGLAVQTQATLDELGSAVGGGEGGGDCLSLEPSGGELRVVCANDLLQRPAGSLGLSYS